MIHLGHDNPAAPPPLAGAHRNRPHLTATIREGRVVVGPLILPANSPCPHCMTLHQADRDATWPQTRPPPTPATLEPCGVATLLAAVAYITGEALAYLNEQTPETLGAEMVITAPGHIRRRTWFPHPSCPCTRRRPR